MSLDKETLKGMFLGHVLRAERGWSEALMIADFENVQESEASEIYAQRFQSQEVPVKTEYEFPCAKGTPRLPNHSGPSSIAEGNIEPEDDVEIEKGDKKWRKTEDSWSLSGESLYRHHEEPRLKFHDPLPIPLKYVDTMRQTQTSVNNVSEHIVNDLWTEAEGVTLSEEWIGTARCQILRTRLSEGYQTRQCMSWSLDTIIQETKAKYIAEWAGERAKLQAARHNRGIYEVLTDDKDDFKVTADARLNLLKDTALALPCIEKDDSRGNFRQLQLQLMPVRNSQVQEIQAHARKWSDNIRTTSPKKSMWEAFTVAWYACQFLFKKLWRYQKPEQSWIKNGIN